VGRGGAAAPGGNVDSTMNIKKTHTFCVLNKLLVTKQNKGKFDK